MTNTELGEQRTAIGPDAAKPRRRVPFSVAVVVVGAAIVIVFVILIVRLTSSSTPSAGVEVVSTFQRPNNDATLGVPWVPVEGVWGVQDLAARVVRPSNTGTAIAVVDTKSPNGTVTMAQSVAAPGTGIVFRYRDRKNYWAIEAAPAYGTWVLREFVSGKATLTANTGLAQTKAGTPLQVTLKDGKVDVFVDGVHRRSFTDHGFDRATKFGLLATGSAQTTARWSRFAVTAQPPVPATSTTVTTPTPAAPPPTTRPSPSTTVRK